ncbi:MAG: exo-alpha-sialidase [Limisphaerales bacterium]
MRGERSEYNGLVALSRWFEKPTTNLAIEFSFAVSANRGRVFHVWTQEPNGKDASQFNLCVQNGKLQHFDGRERTWISVDTKIQPSKDLNNPVWHRLRAVMNATDRGIDLWVSKPGSRELPMRKTATVPAYRIILPYAGFSLVSGRRIVNGAWYLVDDLMIETGPILPNPGKVEPLPEPYQLWSGPAMAKRPEDIPFANGIEHRTIHRPSTDGYKFLHGAALVEHKGVFHANWANSPVNENGPHETLQGRRSLDGGQTWLPLEMVGPGFDGPDRHSHGVLFVHHDEVWTIAARFGVGTPAKRFPGLQGEAFVLNESNDRWESRGIVITNCWPYDEIVRMDNGNFITGGQDKDGLPVIAISQGDDLLKMWDSVLIPYHRRLAPSFAETTVWAEGSTALAVIRGGGGVAWVSRSEDFGRSWSTAQPSNLPMPRAKAYLGKLSTGQLYLVSNFRNRDTLVVSTGQPGELTLNRMWRIRHGKSEAPRFNGFAKSKQWSYPYGYEHDGKLYVVYSVGKEECGLTIVPIVSLSSN